MTTKLDMPELDEGIRDYDIKQSTTVNENIDEIGGIKQSLSALALIVDGKPDVTKSTVNDGTLIELGNDVAIYTKEMVLSGTGAMQSQSTPVLSGWTIIGRSLEISSTSGSFTTHFAGISTSSVVIEGGNIVCRIYKTAAAPGFVNTAQFNAELTLILVKT